MEELIDIIDNRIKRLSKAVVTVGTVKKVNGNTCDVEREGLPTLHDVRLNAIEDNINNPITIIPKQGSKVLVGIIENNESEAFVLQYSEIDFVILRGDTHGGLIKINDLVNKLNTVENAINQLVQDFNTHTHTAPSGATSSPIPTSTVNIINTQVSDLENDKVKHG